MMLFLQIAAALLVSMVLVVVGFWFWIKWRLRRAFRELGDSVKEMGQALQALKSSAGTPSRIHVRALAPLPFDDTAGERSVVAPLLSAGFSDLGSFCVEELPALKVHALMNVQEAAYAVVYEMQGPGVWLDLFCRYPDGTSVTYSPSPETGLERPPGKPIIRDRDADAATLYRRFVQERPTGPFVPVSAETFITRFETAYAEEQDWRNSRGGVSEREIRRIASRQGEPADDFTIQLARHVEAARAAAATSEAVKERFFAAAGWDAQQRREVGDALLVIHERTPHDELVDAYLTAADPGLEGEAFDAWHERESADARRQTADLSPRRAFEVLNATLPAGKRFEKLGDVSDPIAADVYRPRAE
jgi:hypothetical protein